jgi:hypothetical protein
VRVWKGVRTGAQIRETMFQRMTGQEPGLAGLWNFEAITNGIVQDLSPGRHDGKLMGNARVVSASLPRPSELIRPADIIGTVSDVSGQPVAGAAVTLSQGDEKVQTASDAAGDVAVQAVRVSPDGRVWAATWTGASEFDGNRFRSFTEFSGLTQSLWMGHSRPYAAGKDYGGGAAVGKGGEFRHFGLAEVCRPTMSPSSAKGRMAGSGSGPPPAWPCGTEESSSGRPAIPSRKSTAWTGIRLACCGFVLVTARCNTGRMAQAAPLSPERPSPLAGRGSCGMPLGRCGWAATGLVCCASMVASSST